MKAFFFVATASIVQGVSIRADGSLVEKKCLVLARLVIVVKKTLQDWGTFFFPYFNKREVACSL